MRIALLISGRGSTATAIINACKSGALKNVIPACVISSRADAEGILKVQEAGISKDKVYVVAPPRHSERSEESNSAFGESILKICADNKVDFIGQYGWLVKTPENVIKAYQNMMTNQHNGPLPEFGGEGMYGMRVHCARLLFTRKVNRDYWSEAVCQRVGVNFDEGAVIKSARIPIYENDTPEVLAARMLPVEHEVEISALQDFANGTVHEVNHDTVLVRPGEEQILAECKKEAILRYPKG